MKKEQSLNKDEKEEVVKEYEIVGMGKGIKYTLGVGENYIKITLTENERPLAEVKLNSTSKDVVEPAMKANKTAATKSRAKSETSVKKASKEAAEK